VKYNVLVLGASYGSLFSTKLLMAGHRVSLVCTKPTSELINREGTVVRFPIKGRDSLLDISSKKLPGTLDAATPDSVDPGQFDLIVLGMQEAPWAVVDVDASKKMVWLTTGAAGENTKSAVGVGGLPIGTLTVTVAV
jgi:hypothetical protein